MQRATVKAWWKCWLERGQAISWLASSEKYKRNALCRVIKPLLQTIYLFFSPRWQGLNCRFATCPRFFRPNSSSLSLALALVPSVSISVPVIASHSARTMIESVECWRVFLRDIPRFAGLTAIPLRRGSNESGNFNEASEDVTLY